MLVGIGSYVFWDIKLDGQLVVVVMGVNVMKGVSIGDGFEISCYFGSQGMDEISYDVDGYYCLFNYFGGLEGGMINGMFLIINVVMKLILIFYKVFKMVNVVIKEVEKVSVECFDIIVIVLVLIVIENVVVIELVKVLINSFNVDNLVWL